VPHDEVPAILRLMDVFVLPSRSTARWREQFGRVLVEAAATALPIVATDSGEIPFVMRALGGGGRVVPERNPAALRSALYEISADAAGRGAIGRANLAAAHRQFSQEMIATRMAGLLAALGGRR
jgi:glycosyltransferase involved in cell wall biosynthesis